LRRDRKNLPEKLPNWGRAVEDPYRIRTSGAGVPPRPNPTTRRTRVKRSRVSRRPLVRPRVRPLGTPHGYAPGYAPRVRPRVRPTGTPPGTPHGYDLREAQRGDLRGTRLGRRRRGRRRRGRRRRGRRRRGRRRRGRRRRGRRRRGRRRRGRRLIESDAAIWCGTPDLRTWRKFNRQSARCKVHLAQFKVRNLSTAPTASGIGYQAPYGKRQTESNSVVTNKLQPPPT
jgi:hypothetical protein